jgi:hypothetical protein
MRIIARFLEKLLFVEQPLHRDWRLPMTAEQLHAWPDRPLPLLIIDESDAEPDSCSTASQPVTSARVTRACKVSSRNCRNACPIACIAESRSRP